MIGASGAGSQPPLKPSQGSIRPSQGSIHYMEEPLQKMPVEEIVSKGISDVPEGSTGSFRGCNRYREFGGGHLLLEVAWELSRRIR